LDLRARDGRPLVREGKLKDALDGPPRKEAQQIAQVAEWLDAVQLPARKQGDERRVRRAALVASQK